MYDADATATTYGVPYVRSKPADPTSPYNRSSSGNEA
jgi:hypothetical protein